MVMQTTGFNQEDNQLSLVKKELNVASTDSKRRFLQSRVTKNRLVNDEPLILRTLAHVFKNIF